MEENIKTLSIPYGYEFDRVEGGTYIVSDILSRHDKQIRKEIDEEIERFKKEIEAL